MKRTFRGTVRYRRQNTGVNVLLYGRALSNHTHVTYADFRKILGIRCRKNTGGRLNLMLRLIGHSLPWDQWEWSDDEEYQINRLVVEHSFCLYFDRFVPQSSRYWYLDGRDKVTKPCAKEFDAIFPGLLAAVGKGNACEVEITVESYTNG